MAEQDTPVERVSNALRYASSLALSAQLIASGSSLPTDRETNDLVYELLEILAMVTTRGSEAMEPIEHLDRIMKLGQGANHA